ncbi:MAG: transposase [Planctomycetes bacterium]|nr:transposase [Planctomycetota bacterium]
MNQPGHYFLTWTTYGTWLHGDARGWNDRKDDFYPGKHKPDPLLEERRRKQLKHPPTTFTPDMRAAVGAAIREVCEYRGWQLHALNVRTNHVHVVLTADKTIDEVLRDFKAYGTRRLRRDGLLPLDREVWTEGGDKAFLQSSADIDECSHYVLHRQDGGR